MSQNPYESPGPVTSDGESSRHARALRMGRFVVAVNGVVSGFMIVLAAGVTLMGLGAPLSLVGVVILALSIFQAYRNKVAIGMTAFLSLVSLLIVINGWYNASNEWDGFTEPTRTPWDWARDCLNNILSCGVFLTPVWIAYQTFKLSRQGIDVTNL